MNVFEEKGIVGIGSVLIDFLIKKDNNLISKYNLKKGSMSLVNMDMIEKELSFIKKNSLVAPGGSSCNTIVGISQLGGSSMFIGKLGGDDTGRFFKKFLIDCGVICYLLTSRFPTGMVISIITSDAQRTMLTYLGASSTISFKEIDCKFFQKSKIFHLEAYLLFNYSLFINLFKLAKFFGLLISLDLGDFTIVEKNINFLNNIIYRFVDIIIANENEAMVLTGQKKIKHALIEIGKKARIAIVKLGNKGSYIKCNNEIFYIPSVNVTEILDTTGAGDIWNAGFLFSLSNRNKFSIKDCGKISSLCAAKVCNIFGSNISNSSWDAIKREIKSLE